MTKRVLIIGAGATGRGHLGELAFEAGWHPIFADRDQGLIRALRQAGRYAVTLYGPAGRRRVVVDRFTACEVSDVISIVAEALHVPLILTAVFSQNLPALAPVVARIIAARRAAGVDEPLNIVCCENMQHSSTALRGMVAPLLSSEDVDYSARLVGFPDAMISRVVPVPEDPLEMVAEDYNEWTVDAAGWVGPPVDLPAMELVDNQEARLARKFFMHNTPHAICGYWGFHRGHACIHEALADRFVLERVAGAIEELAAVVSRHWGLDLESVREYGLDLGRRGAVAELRDQIARVVRDPLRKLSREERFVAPTVLALDYGLPCRELVRGIAAVLHYRAADDPESVAMGEMLATRALEGALPDILGLPADHPLVGLVLAEYRGWSPPGPA